MTQTPVNECWLTAEPAAIRVPIPWSLDQVVERWSRRRRQRAAGGSGDERNSSMILRRFPTHVAVGFVMNRTDWICMSREVMSWDGIKDDFLQWPVVPAPHRLAGACPSPGYQWSWIRLESTNCLGIGASRQCNDVEWWTLEPSVV